jgi:hypothetical protein
MQTEGFAIRVQEESTIKMINSCFYNNDFFGGGVVVLKDSILTEDGTPIGLHNNFVSSDSVSNLECPFAYQESISSCIKPDAGDCPIVTIPTATASLSIQNTTTSKLGTGKSSSSAAKSISSRIFSSTMMMIASAIAFC